MTEWTIYRLVFPDGRWYVGQTRQTIAERLKSHRRDPNSPVGRRLVRLKQTPEVEVLQVCEDQVTADTVELEWIARFPKSRRLNRQPVRVRQATPAPAMEGRYKCNWCRRLVLVSEMTRDRTRGRGYDYKCARDYRVYSRVSSWLTRKGYPKPYHLSYKLVRGWCYAGRDPDFFTHETYPKVDWNGVLAARHYLSLAHEVDTLVTA